jgi:uncharacterized protein (DUF58 family)
MPPSGCIVDIPTALRTVGNPSFLRKLQRLRLISRQRDGARPGNTPMPSGSQPSGLEIANHKLYAPGDDLRHFDWNAYGRLGEMMVKTFRAEREAPLHIFIDTSASMGVPSADGKLAYATALAASLAYIAMRQDDPIRIVALGNSQQAHVSPVFRHPQRLPQVQAFLSSLQSTGTTELHHCIESYLRTVSGPATAIILSDFLVPERAYRGALELLLARGLATVALRLIGPQERSSTTLSRRVRLRDAESGAERVVELSDQNRARYEQAVRHHHQALKEWCERHAVRFVELPTDRNLAANVFETLPAVGVLV